MSEQFLIKIIEENFPELVEKHAHTLTEAYKTPNRTVQKRKSLLHIISKILRTQRKIESYNHKNNNKHKAYAKENQSNIT